MPPDRRYAAHESMLAAEDLDVVSVGTPSFLHHRHVVDAATSAAIPRPIPFVAPVTMADSPVKS
ncbi:hypothetical protein [Haladaptatus paucihalophilus]|uniref:hypothetical protein n=1 Tax=Haladaptatus paucihalophilus TaxID=367189 RepID=UPI0015C54050